MNIKAKPTRLFKSIKAKYYEQGFMNDDILTNEFMQIFTKYKNREPFILITNKRIPSKGVTHEM